MEIINPMKVNRSEWDEFVYNHPEGNIFQSPQLAEVFEKAKGIEPIALAAIDEDSGQILASLLAYVLKYTNVLSSFTSRAIIRGGPLFLNTEKGIFAAKMLLNHYDSVIRRKALYTDVVNLWDVSNSTASALIGDAGYVYVDELNFLINLNRAEEEIWKDIHKSRKKGINRAMKKGINIEDVHDKELIPIFYSIVEETYKKVKIPLEDISLFDSVFELLVLKKMAKFYLAKYNSIYIGARLVLNYKGLIFDWYAGALTNYLSMYVNELLVWKILKDGTKREYYTFDFGGAGKPNEPYGPREFKRRFGGQLVNFGYYKKIHSPRKLWLAERGFEVWRRIK